jgi:hypothetical protein
MHFVGSYYMEIIVIYPKNPVNTQIHCVNKTQFLDLTVGGTYSSHGTLA